MPRQRASTSSISHTKVRFKGRIELNAPGKIATSPASNRHALLQAYFAAEFSRQLGVGHD